jgi:hypothetical protein
MNYAPHVSILTTLALNPIGCMDASGFEEESLKFFLFCFWKGVRKLKKHQI